MLLRHMAPARLLGALFQVMGQRTEAAGDHHEGGGAARRQAEIQHDRSDDAVDIDRDRPPFDSRQFLLDAHQQATVGSGCALLTRDLEQGGCARIFRVRRNAEARHPS